MHGIKNDVSAKRLAKQSDKSQSRVATCLEHLSRKVEEADDWSILHCAHEVRTGQRHLVVISNDTDTCVRLYFFNQWKAQSTRALVGVWAWGQV